MKNDYEERAPEAPLVIKIGGSTLDALPTVVDEVAALWHTGHTPVIVHGGGPIINAWLQRMGITPRFSNGRRVTDVATLDVVRAVMVGQINSEIIRKLGERGCAAIGITGLDGGLLQAEQAWPELGLVGRVTAIDTTCIDLIRHAHFIPVIAPLGLSPSGECLNINADDAALAIAQALHAAELLFLSDVAGIYDAQGQTLSTITPARAQELIAAGIIKGGMIPKVEACLAALNDIGAVRIIDGAIPNGISQACAEGTRFVRREPASMISKSA